MARRAGLPTPSSGRGALTAKRGTTAGDDKVQRKSIVGRAGLRLDLSAALPHTLHVHETMLTVVETSVFIRRAEKLLKAEDHDELIFYLASHAETGDEIPGTGGLRKLRFATQGRGKSGGVRVIYYFYDAENPLYALLLYGKNEQSDLTPEQKRNLSAMAAEIKAAAKARRGN